MVHRFWSTILAVALALASVGDGPAWAQDTSALQALGERAGLAAAQIHKQLRPYDRALQMRIARGAITADQAAGMLRRKGEELARGAASAPQLQSEEKQEAETFFAFVLQTAANSTRWPASNTPAYHRAYVESMVQRARELFNKTSAAGRSTEIALSMAYRALAMARGELSAQPASASAVATTPAPQRGRVIGCFRDTNAPFDLDGFLERSNQNTPARCIALCESKRFRFAGVQYGQSCLCGNSYGRYGPANNCNMACTGNSAEICGGMNSNNVYSTGL